MEGRKRKGKFRNSLRRMAMECLCSGEQLKGADETVRSSDSTVTKDFSASGYSSRNGEIEQYLDNGNIEEAELSLREGICLNYEEARALLGRLEYQRGHVEAALRVFDGIDISALVPKMKISIARKANRRKTHSQWDSPPMPLHAVSLLMEAMYLKARALHDLGKDKEAAQECKMIMDIVEAAVPEGLPAGFGKGCKLNEIICKSVELLPELWKSGGFPLETISSYRRSLLYNWNLDGETIARIQKKFAVFLLYSGCEARPPNLHAQLDGSFVPRNNMEEAILLLLILLKKFNLNRIERDPSVMHHLTFALSMSGQLIPLAGQFEEVLPGLLDKKECLYSVALCYLAEEDDLSALTLLKRILNSGEDSDHLKELILASKACIEMSAHTEGASYARRAIANMQGGCIPMAGLADLLLGVALSNQARSAISDTDRASWQCEALEALGNAEKKMHGKDSGALYSLSIENAMQRKLEFAAFYAKRLLKFEAGSELRSWLLLARRLSPQKLFADAETVDAALDQTEKWFQRDLLRTKARIQAVQGKNRDAVETKKNYNMDPSSSGLPWGIPLHLLEEITDGFSEERKLGTGAFGKVYMGVKDGKKIAVKMLHDMPGLEEDQFINEFTNLARLQHPNIVQLLGYCHETRKHYVDYNGRLVFAERICRALCFEYMHYGSLDNYLSDEHHGLDWNTRYAIIKGICKGLKYLHEELKYPIYHLDLKPANILLNENFMPKIADFGLSRLFGEEQTQITKSSLGTLGYLPPEYIERSIISSKFDIFSLGVIIIKIMTGPTGYNRSADMSPKEFVELVQENWRKRLQAESKHLLESYSQQVKRCMEIALCSVETDRHKRPSIGAINQKLNETDYV